MSSMNPVLATGSVQVLSRMKFSIIRPIEFVPVRRRKFVGPTISTKASKRIAAMTEPSERGLMPRSSPR